MCQSSPKWLSVFILKKLYIFVIFPTFWLADVTSNTFFRQQQKVSKALVWKVKGSSYQVYRDCVRFQVVSRHHHQTQDEFQNNYRDNWVITGQSKLCLQSNFTFTLIHPTFAIWGRPDTNPIYSPYLYFPLPTTPIHLDYYIPIPYIPPIYIFHCPQHPYT